MPPRSRRCSPRHLAGGRCPARCLVADQAVLTAIGNDVGFELTFSRQLIAFADSADIAMGFSTSGNSENVIRAFEEAKSRGLLTVGFAGYEGGQMAACDALDHCFIVRSHSVHRIQETQAALSYRLWADVQERLSRTGRCSRTAEPDSTEGHLTEQDRRPAPESLGRVPGPPRRAGQRLTATRGTGRPRCSSGSRRSAAAGLGSGTTSSPWHTAPGARHRRR